MLSKRTLGVIKIVWLVIAILIMLSFLLLGFNYKTVLTHLNNKNPDWCNKYDYYMDTDVTQDCFLRCTRLYGCEHNATGDRDNCTCTGGSVKFFTEISTGVWGKLPDIKNVPDELKYNSNHNYTGD